MVFSLFHYHRLLSIAVLVLKYNPFCVQSISPSLFLPNLCSLPEVLETSPWNLEPTFYTPIETLILMHISLNPGASK
uniref:Uncharacterized protein n=1 Tax=Arundo donax TaxID=35708 RepID=A0A0A9AUY6_ARUDO